ncbi:MULTISPECIES: biotin/lipoyl-binding carrier protein [unclassified Rhodococcus (in: high G+C Gram-positive bacteria)]|uniref:biotin/lipoyl-binding carrier protein n=1 Tax=unclassified Rhodococcus (in: high G+C Gram-positive bacteria) TaxID=192944 RepID=UPI00163B17C5|nr:MULTISPECIES: biotin/lipoyl-binding carrier protein [unclassified Rhodococcus (in: high G+C Gram-positive bacteria)]MBC2641990.1 biotin/lipoyl-binding carrier protein [Rhodococcus sp. 3A]MBC2893269.1 biotin/lipoyl-binding carrier protein [Rhodococcus sp. 4CII]
MNEIAAECAATVWKVVAAPGDQVSEGDVLLILESMKMEIPIEAEDVGVVAQIHVAVGASISEGDLLVTLEG